MIASITIITVVSERSTGLNKESSLLPETLTYGSFRLTPTMKTPETVTKDNRLITELYTHRTWKRVAYGWVLNLEETSDSRYYIKRNRQNVCLHPVQYHSIPLASGCWITRRGTFRVIMEREQTTVNVEFCTALITAMPNITVGNHPYWQ